MASLYFETVEFHAESSITAAWTEILPLSPRYTHDVPGFPDYSVTALGWLERISGALCREPVFWLPREWRGAAIVSSGRQVVVGSRSGAVTIINLPGKRVQTPVQLGE
jgi:hypothetical protein